MANFILSKVSDTCYRIQRSRDLIGWCRKIDGSWEAKANGERGWGHTPNEAFRELVRAMNNASAREAGFADARAALQARNEQVRAEADSMNALLAAAGLAGTVRVGLRRGRRVIV